MCLLVLAWKSHPRYRLILAGNRDEFHDRPAAPLNWWQDDPRILGGREWVRLGAVELGLDCLRRYLHGLPVTERIDFERT